MHFHSPSTIASLAPLIRDLALILAVASVVALICQRLKQPVVLGYIIAGILVGSSPGSVIPAVSDMANIRVWGELGVIFLMFSLGLEFSFRRLAKAGISALLTAGFEVSAMLLIGFAMGRLLGWRWIDSAFLGALLSISSTTIIVRALDEMGLKSRRFAELIFAVLIVEDLIAVLILVALSSIAASRSLSSGILLVAAARLVLVVGTWFVTGYFLLPRFVRWVGNVASIEVLTLLSLALCLCLAVLAAELGYSVALGGFIMGSILAESSESYRIEDRLEPLRDLFAAVFFVSVGMLIQPKALLAEAPTILILTAAVLVGKIGMVSLGALLSGQSLRTAIQAGFGMAQIGEFSFIIAGLGLALGATTQPLVPIAASVSLLTAFATPYLIRVSHRAAVRFEKRIPAGLREAIDRYASWSQERQADRTRNLTAYRVALRWFLNGLIVSAVFLLVAEFAYPHLGTGPHMRMSDSTRAIAAWLLAIALSAPFFPGMFTPIRTGEPRPAWRQRWQENPRGVGILFLTRLASLAWLGCLSLSFFPARIAIGLTIASSAILFVFFFRQLEISYKWFESTFLSTFKGGEKTIAPPDVIRELAPWDAHLVRIKVHPNAGVVGRSLAHSELRSRHGISVVAVRRGQRTLVTPGAEEPIYPKDELLVLGTDEQIEAIRPALERPLSAATRPGEPFALERYEMQTMEIGAASSLAGVSIRESGIRRRFGALIVGVERGRERRMNPASDLVLDAGDRLWVVGEKDRLDDLAKTLSKSSIK